MDKGTPLLRRRLLALAGGLCLGRGTPAQVAAGPPSALPDSVKAAYLFKFIDYVDWPPSAFASPEAPIVIGVAGAEGVLAELQHALPGRSVRGRPVLARRLLPVDPVDPMQVCYLGNGVDLAHAGWPQRLRERPVLVVTDDPEGLRYGSMLNFVLVQGKLRFEASVPSADRSGLKLSSRLLAVAEKVVTGP